MSWARKMEQVRSALSTALSAFLKTRLPDANVRAVTDDVMNTVLRVSMDRSATRLRRRLYASWLRPELAVGELIHLTPEGLRPRMAAFEPDPAEVGDLMVDLFRVAALVRGMGGPKGRLSHADRVAAALLIINTVASCTAIKPTPLFSAEDVALLLTLHSVEASRMVKKDAVGTQVNRYFPQWGLTTPPPDKLESSLQKLLALGCISASEDGGSWKLSERLALPW